MSPQSWTAALPAVQAKDQAVMPIFGPTTGRPWPTRLDRCLTAEEHPRNCHLHHSLSKHRVGHPRTTYILKTRSHLRRRDALNSRACLCRCLLDNSPLRLPPRIHTSNLRLFLRNSTTPRSTRLRPIFFPVVREALIFLVRLPACITRHLPNHRRTHHPPLVTGL